MRTLHNHIAGQAKAPVEGQYLDNVNPSTGKVVGQIPDSGPEDIALAVEAAQGAFPEWAARPMKERAQVVMKLAEAIRRRTGEFALAESRDQGKPLWLAQELDLPRAAANLEYFAGAAVHLDENVFHGEGTLHYAERVPVGTVGLITPWNFPLYLLTWKLGPALVMGNTVVAKPSEETSVTAALLGELMADAGLPPGVANLVFGTGQRAGAALVAHPQVPAISFTGGTLTGKRIAEGAARHLKKVALELGGKNATLVCADAPMPRTIEWAIKAAFLNQGEICTCGSRILVAREIYDTFVEAFASEVRKIPVGDPLAENTFLGPVVSASHRDKVLSYIQEAERLGGTIIAGGGAYSPPGDCRDGFFVEPTVITGLDPACSVMQQEIFGPVVTITPFASEEEALALANGTPYGLSASVWTQDVSRAHRLARGLDVGQVWVNTWMSRDLRAPFGGMKASGIGREGGRYSLEFFSEAKTTSIHWQS